MGNSSSRQQRRALARDAPPTIPRPRPVSALSPTLPSDDLQEEDEHAASSDRHSRIRPRSAYQQELLQESWPEETRPSAPSTARRRSRLSRYLDDLAPALSRPTPRSSNRSPQPSRRRNRLSALFHPPQSNHIHDPDRDGSSSPHLRPAPLADPDNPDAPQLDLDNGPRFDLNFANARNSTPGRDTTRDAAPGLADRISSLTPARELTRLRASRRRNRSRRNGADHSMSNILTLAAHALAATLTGNNSQTAVEDLRRAASSVDSDDGSLDAFMQFLQSGRLSSHLAQSMAAADNSDGSPRREDQPPLDFFRMFQLRNTLRPTGRDSTGNSESGNASDDGEEGRMVPILIVGIRSLTANQQASPPERDINTVPHFIDSLARVSSGESAGPGLEPAVGPSTQPPSAMPSQARSARSSRRASLNGLSSSTPEGRRQQWITDIGRPRSEVGLPTTSSTPMGPSAPPTTPASAPLSAMSSGVTTPNYSAPLSEAGPSLSSSPEQHETTNDRPSRPDRSSARRSFLGRVRDDRSASPGNRRSHRRGNGIDFLRHGSGAARRRGIIGPDRPPPDGNRSWIIYVLGGNYPENHPILSTPSLFTDSPTYEDMLLLSSLIGPAKPPVASSEDVAAAGGVYTIRVVDGLIQAVSTDDESDVLLIDAIQTCQICLCGYSEAEVIRRLQRCPHVFHRECVDEWLTTGRNSCPLCRLKGVNDKNPETQSDGGGPAVPDLSPVE